MLDILGFMGLYFDRETADKWVAIYIPAGSLPILRRTHMAQTCSSIDGGPTVVCSTSGCRDADQVTQRERGDLRT